MNASFMTSFLCKIPFRFNIIVILKRQKCQTVTEKRHIFRIYHIFSQLHISARAQLFLIQVLKRITFHKENSEIF